MGNIPHYLWVICLDQRRKTILFSPPKKKNHQNLPLLKRGKSFFDVFSSLTTRVCLGSCAQTVLFAFQGFVCPSLLFSPCPFFQLEEGGRRERQVSGYIHAWRSRDFHSVLGKLSGLLFLSGISMGISYLFPLPSQHCIGRGWGVGGARR